MDRLVVLVAIRFKNIVRLEDHTIVPPFLPIRIIIYQSHLHGPHLPPGEVSAKPETSHWFIRRGSVGKKKDPAVQKMKNMFRDASSANPDTANWRTGKVHTMFGMFKNAVSAKPDTSRWITDKDSVW